MQNVDETGELKVCFEAYKNESLHNGIVSYPCETWILNRSEEEQLKRWKRKQLRAIYGGVNTDD